MGEKNSGFHHAQTLTLCTCDHERKRLNALLTRSMAHGLFQFWSYLNNGSTQFNAYQNIVVSKGHFSSKIWPMVVATRLALKAHSKLSLRPSQYGT